MSGRAGGAHTCGPSPPAVREVVCWPGHSRMARLLAPSPPLAPRFRPVSLPDCVHCKPVMTLPWPTPEPDSPASQPAMGPTTRPATIPICSPTPHRHSLSFKLSSSCRPCPPQRSLNVVDGNSPTTTVRGISHLPSLIAESECRGNSDEICSCHA